MYKRQAEDVRYYVGTNDQTAELFNGVTAEIRRSEGRVQLWTQSGNSRDIQALIIQARTFDPVSYTHLCAGNPAEYLSDL